MVTQNRFINLEEFLFQLCSTFILYSDRALVIYDWMRVRGSSLDKSCNLCDCYLHYFDQASVWPRISPIRRIGIGFKRFDGAKGRGEGGPGFFSDSETWQGVFFLLTVDKQVQQKMVVVTAAI